MKNGIKRIVGIILVFVLAVSMLAGCGKDDGTIKITIGGMPTVRTENNKATYDLFMERKAKFEADNPGIIVEADEFVFNAQDYMVKAAAGMLPTMFTASPTELNQVVQTGYAKDITKLVKKYGYEDALGSNKEKYANMIIRDGEYYGIIQHDSLYNMGMLYNVPLFKQAGLVDEDGIPLYPKTWEELAETAKVIKEKTGKTGFVMCTTNNHGGWTFMNMLWAFGSGLMEVKDGKWTATFAGPEGVAALQYVKDLKWKYDVLQNELLASNDVIGKLVALDEAAMGMYSPAWLDGVVRKYGLKIEDMAMSALPAGPAGAYSQVGASVYMFSGNDKENEAAFKWLEFIGAGVGEVTEETKKSWEGRFVESKEKGWLVGIDPGTPYENAERTQIRLEMMEPYRTVDSKFYEHYLKGEGVTYMFEPEKCVQQMYSSLDSAIQEVLNNKDADCKAVLEKAQADFQANFLDKEAVE